MTPRAKIVGAKSAFTRQPGGTIAMQADGTVEATVGYKGPTALYRQFLPTPLMPHPDFPSLKLYEFRGEEEQGEIYSYVFTYRGVFASADLFLLMQESMTVNTTQEPLETFYKFSTPFTSQPLTAMMIAQVRAALEWNVDITTMTGWPTVADPNLPQPPTWTNVTAGTPGDWTTGSLAWHLWYLKQRGIESYLQVAGTAQLTFTQPDTAVPTPDYLNRVGTLDHATTAWTRSVTVSKAVIGTRDWLFSGVSWRRAGGALVMTEDHSLSGPQGWNPALYTKAT